MTRSQRQTGFSLVEMLAALAILAISGVALMNAMTTSTRAAQLTQDLTLAQITAQNMLSEQLINDRAPLRERRGDYELGGRSFIWTLEIETTSQPNLVRLRLVVADPQTEDVLYVLETLRRVV